MFRAIVPALLLIAAPAFAQAQEDMFGDIYSGLYVDHPSSDRDNGAQRLGQRLGGSGNAPLAPPSVPSMQSLPKTAPGNPLVKQVSPGDRPGNQEKPPPRS